MPAKYVKAYNGIMIRIWKITTSGSQEIFLQDQASLDVITRQLPDGYYSTFRTYDRCTRILGLASHLRRLYDPVLKADASAPELRRQLIPLLEPFRLDEARVRVMMTKQGQVYLAIEPLKPLTREVYTNGVRVETTRIPRHTPRLKSTAFIGASEAERKHIAKEGIFEALLVKNGRILEGMTSNFFYVVGGDAIPPLIGTAQKDILLGVTRKTIIHLARGRGWAVQYRSMKLDQLSTVDEAFITSSSRGVVPVIQIDEVTIGQGRVGRITQMLRSAYEEYVLSHAEKI
jgi:branched-chain amino acid aminotransferase